MLPQTSPSPLDPTGSSATRLAEAVSVMGSIADDTVRRWWPELPDEVVTALEEIGRCRSAALRALPPAVAVDSATPGCPDGAAGSVLHASVGLPPQG